MRTLMTPLSLKAGQVVCLKFKHDYFIVF